MLGVQYEELTKAVGLHAHGVGIGAFVYLRRIVEKLVDDAGEKAVQKGEPAKGLTDPPFDRMSEKIKRLTNYLPQFLVNNERVYGILSDGIHNLSEEQCLRSFSAVKLAIEMILDEELAEQARRKKKKDAAKMLDDLSSNGN